MTSRDVIVALRRSQLRRTRTFPFVRVADLFLAFLWLVYLVALLGGCSTNTSGLSTSLRGRLDVDADTTVATVDGGRESDPISSPIDASTDVQNSTDDAGYGRGPDTQTTVDVGGMTTDANPVEDAGTTPVVCPLDPTRSLSPCNATTALCRTYDTPGHAIYQTNCTAEGYVCVAKCPT